MAGNLYFRDLSDDMQRVFLSDLKKNLSPEDYNKIMRAIVNEKDIAIGDYCKLKDIEIVG